MSSQVHILAGPARSGKTAALVVRYRQLLKDGPIGSALWLAPTRHAARDVRERLLGDESASGNIAGCFSPAVYTFQQFVQTVLAQADRPRRYIGKLLKRQLIERILGEAASAGLLQHFAPIADRPGLIDLLANLISDLKRQEVSPEQFAKCTASGNDSTRKNSELAGLYGEYQRLLDAHHLCDGEEIFSAARNLLKTLPKAHWGPFAGVKCVVADGFSDFTRTQQEILQLLADHTDELTITLPLDQESGRDDLFNKPRQTHAELKKRFSKLTHQWQPRPANSDWPAIAHLEHRLFTNPREIVTCENATGIEIIAAAGQRAEIELLARTIKRLLVLGDEARGGGPICAKEIVVVFRSLESMTPLVEEVFAEYGIPAAIDCAPTLNRAPVLQALVGLLRLQATDWPYRQLLAVLSNNFFQPEWPPWRVTATADDGESQPTSAAAVEWAVRQLQVPKGRKALLHAIEARAKSEEALPQLTADGEPHDETDAARQQERRERFRIAAAVLNQLNSALSPLNKSRSIEQWIAAIDSLAKATGLLSDPDDDNSNDAWAQLKAALAAGDQLETKWLETEPTSLKLDQFIIRLQEILAVERLPMDLDDTGRVRVLAAQSLRAIEVPYLFVAGLSEKSFPLPGRDDRIYSDAEFQALNKAGLRFADQHEWACDEMLLFYEVLTRATRQLVISFPALDASAQPLLESPYLVELQRCFGPNVLQPKIDISLSPVPQHEHPHSPTERRLKAVVELLEEKPQRLAKLARSDFGTPSTGGREGESIIAGLQAIASRTHRDKFGALEGLIVGDAARSLLAKRFGPDHCWSVSRLEEYAYCPFRFFAANVLGLEPLPELALEMDYGRRGLLAHEALAKLHRRLNAAGTFRSPVEVGATECSKLSDETLALLFETVPRGSPLETALRTIDFRLIGEWLQQYLGQHEKYDEATAAVDQALRPAHFEVSFGLKRRRTEEVDPISTEKAFDVCVEGETIRLSGRIDRIDIGVVGGEVVFNIIDYKTGSRKKLKAADFEAGLALQLPLYALAVQELLMIDRRAVPWRVGYWYLKDKGFETHSLPQFFEPGGERLQETEAWRSLRGTLLARVVSLVRGIRGGMFPVYSLDDQCTSRCEFKTVCRIGQIRSQDKVWPEAKQTKP